MITASSKCYAQAVQWNFAQAEEASVKAGARAGEQSREPWVCTCQVVRAAASSEDQDQVKRGAPAENGNRDRPCYTLVLTEGPSHASFPYFVDVRPSLALWSWTMKAQIRLKNVHTNVKALAIIPMIPE